MLLAHRPQLHGQFDLHAVAGVPGAGDFGVTAGLRRGFDRLAVDADAHAPGRQPERVADAQRQGIRRGRRENQGAGSLVGETGFLPQRHAALAPVQLRRHEEIHRQRRRVVRVDELAVAGVVFHAGAGAAPERVEVRAVGAGKVRAQRRVIDKRARAHQRRLRGEDVIEEGVLVVIHVGGIRLLAVKRLGELEHVVGVAGLRTAVVGDQLAHVLRVGEMLVDAVAAVDPGAVFHDGLPEERGGRAGAGVAG